MPEIFGCIRDINPDQKETWSDKIFITLDIDWAHDEVLGNSIDLLERADVCATWFVTHDTPLLHRIRDNPKFELGIHPNFNFLLNGSHQMGNNAVEVIENILKIVPESVSVRSHSMTQSTNLMRFFAERGQKYDCNHFIPHQSNMVLKPWHTWNGLIKIPYFWEDDIACLYHEKEAIPELVVRDGLKVFDFHPIHLFLNTETMERYESTRAHHRDLTILRQHIWGGAGAKTHLEQLIEAGKKL